ncbi:hypothetical protein SAMN05421821_10264 [Mucilaginibacter lappiensis]|uniref:Uncharacterized protein n=1 Tax=Mucilaginibacter lappiensis TaxID=354630 RepID=A0ABR6PG07_9SPHI|nr:hypothetical protein [Mucilaginibacter lappiensis]MBB6108701.1 hypothetical protein [Mucilaginibacter lappiensis]SIQ27253.1 hypothetical protein SAMN05421821_10264 [Mucilaginibacter lappiensis]
MDGFEIDLEQTIDDLFGDEPFGIVDEQLFKWFIYSFVGNGRHIGTLDAPNYTLFKEKLVVLLDAVYKWHKDETG